MAKTEAALHAEKIAKRITRIAEKLQNVACDTHTTHTWEEILLAIQTDEDLCMLFGKKEILDTFMTVNIGVVEALIHLAESRGSHYGRYDAGKDGTITVATPGKTVVSVKI